MDALLMAVHEMTGKVPDLSCPTCRMRFGSIADYFNQRCRRCNPTRQASRRTAWTAAEHYNVFTNEWEPLTCHRCQAPCEAMKTAKQGRLGGRTVRCPSCGEQWDER